MAHSLHSYRGHTLEEAYRRMRGDLGEHAMVVRTTEVRGDGIWGWLGGREIEVTASLPQAPPRPSVPVPVPAPAPTRAGNPPGPATRAKIAQFEQLVRNTQIRTGIDGAGETLRSPEWRGLEPGHIGGAGGERPREHGDRPQHSRTTDVVHGSLAPKLAPAADPQEQTAALRREVERMHEMLSVLVAERPGAGLPPEFAPHYRRLVESGVSRTIAARLIAEAGETLDAALLHNERVVAERLKLLMEKNIATTGGLRIGPARAVVALVGPTGVGKTTTIAKIAAQFAVRQGKRVALITTDTYRIAAPEQLRVYANIIGLPMSVVNDAREMRAALAEYAEYDLVLMDTAGNSQFNTKQINELRLMLTAARPNEVMLVASANTPVDDLRSTLANFNALHPTSLLFSKLDETRRFGHLYTVALEAGLPLSYFSDGQDVPDDLLEADARTLATLVLEGTVNRG